MRDRAGSRAAAQRGGTRGPGLPLRPGDPPAIGPYQVEGRLGSGGMGTVFLARDPEGRLVAVKVIRSDLAADPDFRARFADEVAAARRVKPFCTAQVLDADPYARRPYLVTEYIDGVRLDDVLDERGPLPLSTLQGVAVGVASALTAIHGAGIVHRDLKPSNVLLSLTGPRVIDFGIARALDSTGNLTRAGLVLGSAGWMAPEHMEGLHVGPAADIFAWALLVAYAATGRHPYGDGDKAEVAARMLTGYPDLTGVPPELRGIVAAGLARDPAERPSAEEVLLALLGDRGRRGNARLAATEVIHDGAWERTGRGRGYGTRDAPMSGGPVPEPTRVERPPYGPTGSSDYFDPPDHAADYADDRGYPDRASGPAPGPPRWSASPGSPGGRRRRGGYVRYPEDDAAPAPARPPAPGPRPSPPPHPEYRPDPGYRPDPEYRPRPEYRPHPPAPQRWDGPPTPPPAPGPPPPRRARRRFRIPFKKTIIFILLIILLLSAADRIATEVDEQREMLWERAVTSVQNWVDDRVEDVRNAIPGQGD